MHRPLKKGENMAKSRKSGADVLLDITARLPWWLGVALALLSYLLLHAVAARPPAAPLQSGQMAGFALTAMVQALARIGQYLLPFFFLVGAAVSAFKRRQAAQLHDGAANRADGVAQMNWQEFEVLVGEYFRQQGYTVIEKGGSGPDGGVDLLLQKGADRYLVQCKHWRALRVGVQPVRELYGVMAARRVAGGFVVTSGDFTEEALNFARGREVTLINGVALQKGIRAQSAATPCQPARRVSPVAGEEPACPLCQSPMVMRQARSGPMAGHKFWGCSTYAQTKCRGTRELA